VKYKYQHQKHIMDAEEIKHKRHLYYEENKADILMKANIYYQNNKTERCEKSKDYYKRNKDKVKMRIANKKEDIQEYQKQYYNKNKEKIKENNIQKKVVAKTIKYIKCECGCSVQVYSYKRHLNTDKHKSIMIKLEEMERQNDLKNDINILRQKHFKW